MVWKYLVVFSEPSCHPGSLTGVRIGADRGAEFLVGLPGDTPSWGFGDSRYPTEDEFGALEQAGAVPSGHEFSCVGVQGGLLGGPRLDDESEAGSLVAIRRGTGRCRDGTHDQSAYCRRGGGWERIHCPAEMPRQTRRERSAGRGLLLSTRQVTRGM